MHYLLNGRERTLFFGLWNSSNYLNSAAQLGAEHTPPGVRSIFMGIFSTEIIYVSQNIGDSIILFLNVNKTRL